MRVEDPGGSHPIDNLWSQSTVYHSKWKEPANCSPSPQQQQPQQLTQRPRPAFRRQIYSKPCLWHWRWALFLDGGGRFGRVDNILLPGCWRWRWIPSKRNRKMIQFLYMCQIQFPLLTSSRWPTLGNRPPCPGPGRSSQRRRRRRRSNPRPPGRRSNPHPSWLWWRPQRLSWTSKGQDKREHFYF